MVKIELHSHGTDAVPVPCFTTNAEIELAEHLRHQLEERWLAPSAPSAFAGTSEQPPVREAPIPGKSYRKGP